MSKELKSILDELIEKVQGIVGVILIDIDGIPMELSGKFDLPPEDLGALLSASFHSYEQVGKDLGQQITNTMVEYNNLKLYQCGMPRGGLIIIADKDAYLGMIRMEAKRAISRLSEVMMTTEEERKRLMVEHKFRAPDEKKIKDILSKFG